MSILSAIAEQISATTGSPFDISSQESVSGGCINSVFRLNGGGRSYFVKTNSVQQLAMFEAEAAGLLEISGSGAIRVPLPVCCGHSGDSAYLVLENITFGHGNGAAMERFGRQLAEMHRCTSERFGWDIDNTIGSTPQVNTPDSDWVAFFREQRLRFQFELAARRGNSGRLLERGEHLLESLDSFFDGYRPVPSLLHGDLWSGNYAIDTAGEPVIYDPAVYYGDREADIAMTELFGGFGHGFHAAYREAWPLDRGYSTRKALYNLYHILNHLNLFGGGYYSQASSMVDRLLAAARA